MITCPNGAGREPLIRVAAGTGLHERTQQNLKR